MAHYSENFVNGLNEELPRITEKYQHLILHYAICPLENVQAKEFATQGYGRRLKLLARCVNRVFSLLPPEILNQPSEADLSDTTIFLQAFVFNIFGCIDNLAWVWVLEKGVTQQDGSPIPATWVGLRRGNSLVRQTLSQDFQSRLAEFDPWFDQLDGFRHALAHRVPLYIPPYTVSPKNQDRYLELDSQKMESYRSYNFEEYDRLTTEQDEFGVFKPIFLGSPSTGCVVRSVHEFLLMCFNTLEDISLRMLTELSTLREK